jgi:3-methylcrotonyl-CoA carboxylase alpha subunit
VIARLAAGTYRVEHEGRSELLNVAGPENDRWVFWNGLVFRGDFREQAQLRDGTGSNDAGFGSVGATATITAPMPARVSRILARPGAAISKGDTLVVLDAMKMELPLRAPGSGVVTAVHCREGELVTADAALVEIGPR